MTQSSRSALLKLYLIWTNSPASTIKNIDYHLHCHHFYGTNNASMFIVPQYNYYKVKNKMCGACVSFKKIYNQLGFIVICARISTDIALMRMLFPYCSENFMAKYCSPCPNRIFTVRTIKHPTNQLFLDLTYSRSSFFGPKIAPMANMISWIQSFVQVMIFI